MNSKNSWYGRLIGIALAGAYFLQCASHPTDPHFIDTVNLIFHEAGHSIFIFFGNFIHVLMGSGFQILLPLLIAAYFFYNRQYLSGSVCLMWAGENLTNVAVYAGDSIAMELPLLGGDSSMHDWHYLLDTMNILRWTPQIAETLHYAGIATILAGIGIALFFLINERTAEA